MIRTRAEFRIAERPDEFHVRLQNTYPLTTPGNGDVRIVEWGWKHERCNLTAWLHDTSAGRVVLEAAIWSDAVEF
jgi:hypothetical protein